MARSSTTVPPRVVPCDCCPNRLLECEAAVSRRALGGAVLCWKCRRDRRSFATVHQVPAGCSVLIAASGYGLWNATLKTPDGRQFTASALADHLALSRVRAAAAAAGAL